MLGEEIYEYIPIAHDIRVILDAQSLSVILNRLVSGPISLAARIPDSDLQDPRDPRKLKVGVPESAERNVRRLDDTRPHGGPGKLGTDLLRLVYVLDSSKEPRNIQATHA